MIQCPKDFDDERITRNRKARGDPTRNICSGGDVVNGGLVGGVGGGRDRGGN